MAGSRAPVLLDQAPPPPLADTPLKKNKKNVTSVPQNLIGSGKERHNSLEIRKTRTVQVGL